MKNIIKKELLLSGVLFLLGLLILNLLDINMLVSWLIFSVILTVLFVFSTFLFNWLLKKLHSQVGLIFAGTTLFSQAVLLLLLFIILEPTDSNHRAFAILSLTNYLICLLIDTRWKLKWFFKPPGQ